MAQSPNCETGCRVSHFDHDLDCFDQVNYLSNQNWNSAFSRTYYTPVAIVHVNETTCKYEDPRKNANSIKQDSLLCMTT